MMVATHLCSHNLSIHHFNSFPIAFGTHLVLVEPRPWRLAPCSTLAQTTTSLSELLKGIEPSTSSLPRKCSTPELQQPFKFKTQNFKFKITLSSKPNFFAKVPNTWNLESEIPRAGDEARTRDLQLGRLPLYQLSYSRILETQHYVFSLVGRTGFEPVKT